jgi:hypothetical protein
MVTVSVAMVHLAFQTIAFTLVLKEGCWTRTQWEGHGRAGLSFPLPLPFPVSISISLSLPVSIPVPISLALALPDRASDESRPR